MRRDREFYDLCYEAWRRGINPDAVDIDRYDDMRARGYYPDEITLNDVMPRAAPADGATGEGDA